MHLKSIKQNNINLPLDWWLNQESGLNWKFIG